MCLDCLGSAKLFSTLDLQSGYWQIEMDKDDRAKTAFITKHGLFEYNKMPFGLATAPSTFQRCMEMVLRGLQWKSLLIYLDDIIIFSSTFDEHIVRLNEVLNRLAKAGLKLKPSKCHLLQKEVLFLGHIVGQEGVKPNPKIIEAVKSWKPPTNVKEVQQFLGLCNYYRQFVKGFSELATPLSRLTQKNVKFKWTEECDTAFVKLKSTLTEAPVLSLPEDNGSFIIDTDASDIGIGGVLSQIQNGKEHVIAYASKKLNRTQRRYSVTKRELLAVVTFIHQFRHYLLGRKFLLRTDHSSLRWLFNFKDPQGQLARWLEVLAQYHFDIQHREGKKHQNADALSRKDYELQEDDDVHKEDWQDFEENVNDVNHISHNNHHPECRVITRGQSQSANLQESTEDVTYMIPNWSDHYTAEELSNFQKNDPVLKEVFKWKENDQRPCKEDMTASSPAQRSYWIHFDNLKIVNGILYKKHFSDDPNAETSLRLMVPVKMKKELLELHHNTVLSAHMGVNKTIQKLRKKFYWYKMDLDIKLFIRGCPTCCRSKQPSTKPRAPLEDYRVGYPLDRVALDVMGPLPTTRNDNKYILVIGDYFTRWMEAYSLPNQQTEEVAKMLSA